MHTQRCVNLGTTTTWEWVEPPPHILDHIYNIMVRSPPREYFLDLKKSVLVVSEENLVRA